MATISSFGTARVWLPNYLTSRRPNKDEQISRFAVLYPWWLQASPRANAEPLMCEKCVEIDKNIDRYRRIQRTIPDQVTIERTKELIAELVAQKAELHPE